MNGIERPTSWAEFLDKIRRDAPHVGFYGDLRPRGPAEGGDYFLERVERYLARLYRGGARMPAVQTLPWGLLLGDTTAADFGGTWEYPAWVLEQDAFLDGLAHLAVVIPLTSGEPAKLYPMLRIDKFLNRCREDNLSSWHRFTRRLVSGQITLEQIACGKWSEIGSDRFRSVKLSAGG